MFSTTRPRRRTTNAIPTRPRITSTSRPDDRDQHRLRGGQDNRWRRNRQTTSTGRDRKASNRGSNGQRVKIAGGTGGTTSAGCQTWSSALGARRHSHVAVACGGDSGSPWSWRRDRPSRGSSTNARSSTSYPVARSMARSPARAGHAGSAALARVCGSSSLEWLGGVAVLHANGDAHAIGAAHGRLLAPLLPGDGRRGARPSIEATITDEGILGHTTHAMRLAWHWRFIDDGLSWRPTSTWSPE